MTVQPGGLLKLFAAPKPAEVTAGIEPKRKRRCTRDPAPASPRFQRVVRSLPPLRLLLTACAQPYAHRLPLVGPSFGHGLDLSALKAPLRLAIR